MASKSKAKSVLPVDVDKQKLASALRDLSKRDSLDAARLIYGEFLGKAIAAFTSEPAILDVKSDSVVIVGDLHGDTSTFRKITRVYSPRKYTYILMGDNVDRGENSTELLAMLLASKLINGKNFIMLRGDHESKEVNPQNFPYELKDKLNNREMVYKVYDELFTKMPLAVVLNNRYFIVHGGIPISQNSIEELRGLKKVDNPSDNESIKQMLWNDPAQGDFLLPSARGRGIYLFGNNITDAFLKNNGFELIIRGHEHGLGGCRLMGGTLTLLTTTAYPADRQFIAKLEKGKLNIYDVSDDRPVLLRMKKLVRKEVEETV